MKKVDVIFPSYINATIGPTGTLKRLIENKSYLEERNYNLRVFTLDYLQNDSINDVTISLPLRNRNLIGKIKKIIKKSRFLSQLYLHFYEDKNANKLINKYITLHNDGDIIVFHEDGACYHYLNDRRKKKNVKIILFHHSDGTKWNMMLQSWPKIQGSFYYKLHDKRKDYVNNNVNISVFIAKKGLSNFQKEYPNINNEHLYFLHNGIDYKAYNSQNKTVPPYRLITIGSVILRKGQRFIVEALSLLIKEKLPNFRLDIIGVGADIGYIEHIINSHGLKDIVHLRGNISNENIHDILCNADIFILMSNNEGLPISIIEGMRAGLPIISTPVGGIPELVDNTNGILIQPSTENLLTIFSNIDNYNWNLMGANSRKRFEKEFTFDIMISKYCDMLDRL